jgi:hypothetical protein
MHARMVAEARGGASGLHARRVDALSLRGVFSFLASGAVLSLGTNALFNLCPATPPGSSDAGAAADGAAAGGGGAATDVCTSYWPAGSAHPKLLRTSSPPTSRFKVQAVERQLAPKPKARPSVGRAGGGHRG